MLNDEVVNANDLILQDKTSLVVGTVGQDYTSQI